MLNLLAKFRVQDINGGCILYLILREQRIIYEAFEVELLIVLGGMDDAGGHAASVCLEVCAYKDT